MSWSWKNNPLVRTADDIGQTIGKSFVTVFTHPAKANLGQFLTVVNPIAVAPVVNVVDHPTDLGTELAATAAIFGAAEAVSWATAPAVAPATASAAPDALIGLSPTGPAASSEYLAGYGLDSAVPITPAGLNASFAASEGFAPAYAPAAVASVTPTVAAQTVTDFVAAEGFDTGAAAATASFTQGIGLGASSIPSSAVAPSTGGFWSGLGNGISNTVSAGWKGLTTFAGAKEVLSLLGIGNKQGQGGGGGGLSGFFGSGGGGSTGGGGAGDSTTVNQAKAGIPTLVYVMAIAVAGFFVAKKYRVI
jgi:hypothetical protein